VNLQSFLQCRPKFSEGNSRGPEASSSAAA
jgi:hypothetical protein